MKLIVTGFNPFGEFTVNPSQESVSELDAFVKHPETEMQLALVKLTLPTCCTDAFEEVKREVEADELPFAIVLSGLADSRNKICLERFALNVRNFRMPDNNGHQWDEEHIHENAPDAIRTKLPLRALYSHLDNQGFACDISDHAGTYVCNETYFRCLHSWQENPRCRGVLFVHLPPYEGYIHTNPNPDETRSVKEIYTDCFKSIAEFFLSNCFERTT